LFSRATHSLQQHCWKKHSKKTKYNCPFCEATFLDTAVHYKHANDFHLEQLKRCWKICRSCDKYFPTLPSLHHHYNMWHNKNSFSPIIFCQQCLHVFGDEFSRDKHKIEVHKKDRIRKTKKSEQKNKADKTKRQITAGTVVNQATGKSVLEYKCSFCSSNFIEKEMFYSHVNENHFVEVEGSWERCSDCSRLFPNCAALKFHITSTSHCQVYVTFLNFSRYGSVRF
jgi:hypothetical protein